MSSYRPVTVLAKDAETGKPIPGAEVRVGYPYSKPSEAPPASFAITGPDGIAHVRAAPYGDFDLSMTGNASKYMPESQAVPVKTVAAIEPAHLFEQVEQRPVQFVLAMYADPHPAVELIVPNGYRGVVKAEILVQENTHCPPGKRCFSYAVPSTGQVQVTGPALLGRVSSLDVNIKNANGVPLSGDATNSAIGFWFVKSEGNAMYFFVGTFKEYITQYPDVVVKFKAHNDGRRSPGDGQSGGKGRHIQGMGGISDLP
jgi:hypothetical protein